MIFTTPRSVISNKRPAGTAGHLRQLWRMRIRRQRKKKNCCKLGKLGQ